MNRAAAKKLLAQAHAVTCDRCHSPNCRTEDVSIQGVFFQVCSGCMLTLLTWLGGK